MCSAAWPHRFASYSIWTAAVTGLGDGDGTRTVNMKDACANTCDIARDTTTDLVSPMPCRCMGGDASVNTP
jgi:hypothetical protein